MLQHKNVINSWPKVRLNQNQIETVYVIETDLPLLPDDAAYDHEAFNGFVEAIRSYLAEHPSFDSPRPAIRHRKCRPPLICTLVRQQQGAIVMVTKLARPLSLGGLCLNSGPSSRHAQEKSFMPAAPPISVH